MKFSVKGIQASILKTKWKIWSAKFLDVVCYLLSTDSNGEIPWPNTEYRTRTLPPSSKNKCLWESSLAGVDWAARLFSVAEAYKKRGGLRITLKIKEQTAVNAIKTCWLQSVTGCLGEITGPRTAEHLNKRQQNVFYEDINMPLNYRVKHETECTQLPEVCIISLYKRTSKPYHSTLEKKRQNKTLHQGEQSSSPFNHNLFQGKIKSLHIGTILTLLFS